LIIWYNTLFFTAVILCLPLILPAVILSEKRRKTVLGRLGISAGKAESTIISTSLFPISDPIWVHALSVGEVLSARPLVRGLRERFGDKKIFFSASTKTGFEIARECLDKYADAFFFFPYDLIFSVRHTVDMVNPAFVVIVETDIWPNFLFEMEKRDIPVILVNARLSEKSFRGYRRIPFSDFAKTVFSKFSKVCAQSPRDARRFGCVGLSPDSVMVSGNMKFDQHHVPVSAEDAEKLRASLNIPASAGIIVAGSTHEGEEGIISDALSGIRRACGATALIIVPRNPERAKAVCRIFRTAGFSVVTLSELEKSPDKTAEVIVIDVIGLLSRLYALADAAFIGGSLVPVGGHNPLEAAAFARAIFFGPHMSDFTEISEMLLESGGAVRVGDTESFQQAAVMFLSDEKKARYAGEQAFEIFDTNKGAVRKTLDAIEQVLSGQVSNTPDG